MNYLELIQELNQELYDEHSHEEEQFFYTASGFVDIIGFGDIMLWNSENDDRKFIVKTNDLEPLKPFIKEKLKRYANKLLILSS